MREDSAKCTNTNYMIEISKSVFTVRYDENQGLLIPISDTPSNKLGVVACTCNLALLEAKLGSDLGSSLPLGLVGIVILQ